MEFLLLMKQLTSKRVFYLLEYYNLNMICFSITLSSKDILGKVLEIIQKKQSRYINFSSISTIDLLLVYLHKILDLILTFIYYQVIDKHTMTNLSLLHYHISTIYDALDNFNEMSKKKR